MHTTCKIVACEKAGVAVSISAHAIFRGEISDVVYSFGKSGVSAFLPCVDYATRLPGPVILTPFLL